VIKIIDLPIELQNTFLRDVHFIKHLISLEFTSYTCRYTECDQDIYYDGHWYESHPVQFDTISMGTTLEAITLKITLSNIDKKFSSLVLTEKIQDKVCQIKRIYLTKDLSIIGAPRLVFYGYCDDYNIDKKDAEINISDELIRWKRQIPCRMHDEHCWKSFKGDDCHYVDGSVPGDDDWCDHTLARCIALENDDNFEGFSHVIELMDKEIWWGKCPKTFTSRGAI
jgi:phage-related protein